jgi:NAD-dependent DNA ligase
MSEVNSLSGKQIAITASILGGTREQWGEAIRGAAGYLEDNFTRHTNYSVIREEPGKGKMSAAPRYRMATLEMSNFRGLLTWSKEDIAHANQDFVNTLAGTITEVLGP